MATPGKSARARKERTGLPSSPCVWRAVQRRLVGSSTVRAGNFLQRMEQDMQLGVDPFGVVDPVDTHASTGTLATAATRPRHYARITAQSLRV